MSDGRLGYLFAPPWTWRKVFCRLRRHDGYWTFMRSYNGEYWWWCRRCDDSEEA